jgi:hypothetical protein
MMQSLRRRIRERISLLLLVIDYGILFQIGWMIYVRKEDLEGREMERKKEGCWEGFRGLSG